MGLQPIPSKSQPAKQQALTTPQKHCVQTSVQTKTENSPKIGENQGENHPQNLPADLAEIIAVWPELGTFAYWLKAEAWGYGPSEWKKEKFCVTFDIFERHIYNGLREIRHIGRCM